MNPRFEVPSEAFSAIQNVDIDRIASMEESQLRALLPCLVRMSLCAPLDVSSAWVDGRKQVLRVLSGLEVVNSIVALLSVDFNALEQDARKELQLRTKLGESENLSTAHIQHGLALEFERSDPARRLRILISELLFVSSQIRDPTDFVHRPCELFESEVYMEEVSDVLCIAQAELPILLKMPKIAEALLRMKFGPLLLCRLIANVPDSFYQVCKSLIVSGEKQDEETTGGRRRTEVLRMLSRMNPSQALTIRALAVEQCRLPGLAVHLSLDHKLGGTEQERLSDVIGFVSGLLLGSNSQVRNWFSQFIRSGQKHKYSLSSSPLHALRKHLLLQLKVIAPPGDGHNDLSERQVVQASALIRLYCALKGIAGMKFTEEETRQLLHLLTSHPCPTPAGIRFISLGLCMLLACPLLISQEEERIVIKWINWLVGEGPRFERESGVSSSFSEMLLLIAIHFHANQVQAILDLVCSTLGMKIHIRPNSLARISLMFMQEIFTEQVVTAHAVTVPVTPALSGSVAGFLPVHCLYHLLKNRSFAKNKVPVKDWIYKQICNTTSPLHPLLPPLLEVFVNSVVVPTQVGARQFRNSPLTEREILSVFKSSSVSLVRTSVSEAVMEVDGTERTSGLTAQLLMLYYVLLYEDCLLNNMKHLVLNNEQPHSYSSKLMPQIPIKYLLHQCQNNNTTSPPISSFATTAFATHYPHLCLVEEWLGEEMEEEESGGRQGVMVMERCKVSCTPEKLKSSLQEVTHNPSRAILLLEALNHRQPHHLMEYADVVVTSLCGLLQDDIPRKVKEMVVQLWRRLNTIMPRKLRVNTVNALTITKPVAPYTEEDITLDPLIVLRCDTRVFRCPPVLDIVLKILLAYMAASRAYLSAYLQRTPNISRRNTETTTNPLPSDQEREELKGALVATQESAAIQILLEICLPFTSEKTTESKLSVIREVQCQVCSLLHQMFIADPYLAKLVHFHGYSSELLPVAVAGIPSMHICLDFIPELLSQPQQDKQIFAIELVSHLCLQYALPKSLSVARLTVNVMSTLLAVLPEEKLSQFFLPTLPALIRICQAFPPMYEDVTSLLIQIGRMVSSQMAANDMSTTHTETSFSHDYLSLKENAKLQIAQKNRDRELRSAVAKTFHDIVQLAVVNKKVF
ncbi:integrator complex subunit 2-like [Amphiura filiformis]|uniref:integrator complex subunit 2-like n=1 Tax=Amphiura filiformis TaxID=82378 RepID=UPI003B21C705